MFSVWSMHLKPSCLSFQVDSIQKWFFQIHYFVRSRKQGFLNSTISSALMTYIFFFYNQLNFINCFISWNAVHSGKAGWMSVLYFTYHNLESWAGVIVTSNMEQWYYYFLKSIIAVNGGMHAHVCVFIYDFCDALQSTEVIFLLASRFSPHGPWNSMFHAFFHRGSPDFICYNFFAFSMIRTPGSFGIRKTLWNCHF